MTGAPGSDLPETQVERTLLAWRRTLIGVLAVLGIGGIHATVENHPWQGLLAGLLSLVALIPIVTRINELRRGDLHPATWQPAVLIGGLVVLAVGLYALG